MCCSILNAISFNDFWRTISRAFESLNSTPEEMTSALADLRSLLLSSKAIQGTRFKTGTAHVTSSRRQEWHALIYFWQPFQLAIRATGSSFQGDGENRSPRKSSRSVKYGYAEDHRCPPGEIRKRPVEKQDRSDQRQHNQHILIRIRHIMKQDSAVQV